MRSVMKLLCLALGAALLFGGCSVPTGPSDPLPAEPASTAAPTGPAPTEPLTVTVAFPEGFTALQIAQRLEEKGVCAADEFLEAVQGADLSAYPFADEIPSAEEKGRVWRLEGYLFPDTYEFYFRCGGEAALAKFLQNFARKSEQFRQDLDACGLTMDQAVTLASILQWEGSGGEDMARMSRVFYNRLESPSYPKLQSDVTKRYCRQLEAAGVAVKTDLYDTYVCRGLPAGPICNPGQEALRAAVGPSGEEVCAGCYFFFTDEDTGEVYYSRTYEQHQRAWNELQKKKAQGGESG